MNFIQNLFGCCGPRHREGRQPLLPPKSSVIQRTSDLYVDSIEKNPKTIEQKSYSNVYYAENVKFTFSIGETEEEKLDPALKEKLKELEKKLFDILGDSTSHTRLVETKTVFNVQV